MKSKHEIGYMGEYYVLNELAKGGLIGTKMSSEYDYDILCTNDCRVEVKTSRLGVRKQQYRRKDGSRKDESVWSFANHTPISGSRGEFEGRDRRCDVFVFVCYDSEGLNVERVYVVPKVFLTKALNIKIPFNDEKSRFKRWKGCWELVFDFRLESRGEVVPIVF